MPGAPGEKLAADAGTASIREAAARAPGAMSLRCTRTPSRGGTKSVRSLFTTCELDVSTTTPVTRSPFGRHGLKGPSFARELTAVPSAHADKHALHDLETARDRPRGHRRPAGDLPRTRDRTGADSAAREPTRLLLRARGP